MPTNEQEAQSLARERVVQKLFRLYRSMDGKATRALIDSYLEPIEDYSASAAQQAFERFRDGEVDPEYRKWVPPVPEWVAQVKMLDGILNRVTKIDGIISYKIGALPPPGFEPLGPTKLEIGGRIVDVTHLSLEQKNEAINTGKLPDDEKPDGVQPKLQRF